MSYSEAQRQAKSDSLNYGVIMYVIETAEGKRYAVVSESRYNVRGLENRIMCIYEGGQPIG